MRRYALLSVSSPPDFKGSSLGGSYSGSIAYASRPFGLKGTRAQYATDRSCYSVRYVQERPIYRSSPINPIHIPIPYLT